MTTTITLPDHLAEQLQRRAAAVQRSVEALALSYIESGLTKEKLQLVEHPTGPLDADAELLALVARIKATPPNPARIIPAQGHLAEVLQMLEMLEVDDDYDLDAQIAALDAAEVELRAINHADNIHLPSMRSAKERPCKRLSLPLNSSR